jgi:hypothetical protein
MARGRPRLSLPPLYIFIVIVDFLIMFNDLFYLKIKNIIYFIMIYFITK